MRIQLTDAQLSEVERIIRDTPLQQKEDEFGKFPSFELTLQEAAQRVRGYLSTTLEVLDAN